VWASLEQVGSKEEERDSEDSAAGSGQVVLDLGNSQRRNWEWRFWAGAGGTV
jgi:hypothetical protein